jgi:hypothetical protein
MAFRFPAAVTLVVLEPPFEENDKLGFLGVGMWLEDVVLASSRGLDGIAFGSGSGGRPLSTKKQCKYGINK